MQKLSIVQYTQPGCNPCRMGIIMLDRLGIKHDQIDVTKSDEASDFVRNLNYTGTPVYAVVDESGQLVEGRDGLPSHWPGNNIDNMKMWLGTGLMLEAESAAA